MEELYTIIEVSNNLQYAIDPISIGVAAISGLAGVIKGIKAKKEAEKILEEAKDDYAEKRGAYIDYASQFDIPSFQGGTTAQLMNRIDTGQRDAVFNPAMSAQGLNIPMGVIDPDGTQFTPGLDFFEAASVKDQYGGDAGPSAQNQGNTIQRISANTAGTTAATQTGMRYDPATNEMVVTKPDGTETRTTFSLNNELLANIPSAAEMDAKLNSLNIMGNGVMNVPYWENNSAFKEWANANNYSSTNPNSFYYDETVDVTGPKGSDTGNRGKLSSDEDGNMVFEYTQDASQEMLAAMESFPEGIIDFDKLNKQIAELPKNEDGTTNFGLLDLEQEKVRQGEESQFEFYREEEYTQAVQQQAQQQGTGVPTTTAPVRGGSEIGTITKPMGDVNVGGQLYANSNILNPYSNFQDLSSVVENRSDLVRNLSGARNLSFGERDLTRGIEDLSERTVDLRQGARDFSGLASDTSTLASNSFANLQVATQAADLQAQQTDQALANTLSTIRATGAGAGGATAIAQAALQSKLNISATIEQQEARNVQSRAQGQQQVEQIRMSESRRLQDIAFSERLRLEALREREGLRIDDTRLDEGREIRGLQLEEGRALRDLRVDEGRQLRNLAVSEGQRLQQTQLSEALRTQAVTLAEQQQLREAGLQGIQYQQGIAFDRVDRNLDRLSGIATQSMVNQQAADASRAAQAGAVTGGLLQLAGSLGAAAIKG